MLTATPVGLAIVELALADVDADASLQAEAVEAGDDCVACAYCARGSVEGSEEAIACGVALLAPEAG